jgi:hypothetical protein
MVARRSRVSFLVRPQPPVPFTAVAALRRRLRCQRATGAIVRCPSQKINTTSRPKDVNSF